MEEPQEKLITDIIELPVEPVQERKVNRSNEKLKQKYCEDIIFREMYKEKQRIRYRKKKEEEYLKQHGSLDGFKINSFYYQSSELMFNN